MDDLTRAEYPAMLGNLDPSQAVQILNDRVRRINRINLEVADWIQERRRIEEQYVMSLRKLSQLRVPGSQSELGVFSSPWTRISDAVETIAISHHEFAQRLEADIENPLRNFQQRQDVANMSTIAVNLSNLSKELEDAQDKSDKLNRKGAKASTQKVDEATAKLESANQQWESQAPFVFESLQALDESRVNHLRDILTQYQTHESDQAQRTLDTAGEVLGQIVDINTEKEVQNFAKKMTSGRAKVSRPESTRHGSVSAAAGETQPPASAAVPAATPVSTPGEIQSASRGASRPALQPTESQEAAREKDMPAEPKQGKLRRLGTMFGGRRRQSTYGGVGHSPQKGGVASFGRLGSSHGRGLSPQTSSGNLNNSQRMDSLAESDTAEPSEESRGNASSQPPQTNGAATNLMDTPVPTGVNGTTDVSDVPPPAGPPPSHQKDLPSSPAKDSEGFTIPSANHDPIAEAQREAAGEDADHPFKLNIQNQPVADEDPEAKQAALSSVANSLRLGPATRRSGTVRGRRDVRNTVYVPSPTAALESPAGSGLASIPGSPDSPAVRPPGLANLASETSVTGTSDTQSIRSGYSLGGLNHIKHPEMTEPGLQSSIIETLTISFEDGEIKSASMAGEIAFVNNVSETDASRSQETIRINNFPNLDRIGPNRIFVQNASSEQPDQYTLDVSHLTRPTTAFSYRVFSEQSDGSSALGQNASLLIKPAWKPQGDKLGLLLQYQLNPQCTFTEPVTLHNVAFVATYEGRANGAQTKPTGTHLREKHLVYWRLGEVTLTEEVQKIVCRIVGAEGTAPQPGHIEARWEYVVPAGQAPGSGISISRLADTKGKAREDDPFADEGGSTNSGEKWLDVPAHRRLTAGKYEGR